MARRSSERFWFWDRGGSQIWFCYAEPLAEKRKSGISGKRHKLKPIPWENSWAKLGEEEDEEGEPAIERRRECTDLGLDLSQREEQVVCHASALALALAMTDEARREVEM